LFISLFQKESANRITFITRLQVESDRSLGYSKGSCFLLVDG
jgi:hypothetical protein